MVNRWLKFLVDNNEMLVWTFGLGILIKVGLTDGGQSLCLFKAVGFGTCPGCGLGHSIGYLLRGDIALSFKAHLFGAPGFMILIGRIACLVKQCWYRRQSNLCRI